jgi:sugar O-acyltransferase (sialic acid O-acetyltransferase NeuD family)
MKTHVVYGARGHGHVVADALLSCGIDVVAFIDDDATMHGQRVFDIPVRGFDWLRTSATDAVVALAIGDNAIRRTLAERCASARMAIGIVVHPRATVSARAQLGRGTVVLANAVINANAHVGDGVIVNTGAIVEHDVVVGDYAHVSPNAVLAGGTKLGELSQLGAGAIVIDDRFVGSRTTIGAGAVVTRHIGDDIVAYGVPARAHRRNER